MKNVVGTRILLIVPSLRKGGAERIVSYLAQGLGSPGTRVDLLLRDPVMDYTVPEGCTVHVCGGGALSLPRTFFRLLRFKRKGAYDIYNSHMASSNFLNLVTGRGKKKAERILTIHSITSIQMNHTRLGFLYNHVIRLLYSRAEKIVAASPDIGEDLHRFYGIPLEKIRVITNGNDIRGVQRKMAEPLSKEENAGRWLEGKPVVTAMGRYTEVKGHIPLLYAFARLVSRYPDARLLLIGDGELRKTYEKLIQELDLTSRVILTGWRENPFRLIARSDMFVMPSLYEGYGNALAEAIFCLVPCVAADFSQTARQVMEAEGEKPVTENLYQKGGILCPVPREEDREQQNLYEAMVKLVEDPAYAASCATYHMDREKEFSLEGMLEQWRELFVENIGEKSPKCV